MVDGVYPMYGTKNTKIIAALAVLVMAFAAFAIMPAADATDDAPGYEADFDAEKGTITLTIAEIVDAKTIEAMLGSYEGAIYKIALTSDLTLNFDNMSDYEVIRPYVNNGFVEIPVADMDLTVAQAVAKFIDAETVAYNPTPENAYAFTGEVFTEIVMQTPAVANAESAAALAEAFAAIEEKDAQIADLQAAIDADDSAAEIAALTAAIGEKDAKIVELEATIAELQKENKALDQPEEKLWETGLGQCLIIIVAFLAGLVIWYLYKEGKLDRIFKRKKKTVEAPKE